MQQQAYQSLPQQQQHQQQQQREEPAQSQVPHIFPAPQRGVSPGAQDAEVMLTAQLQSAPFGSTARAPVPNTGLSIPEDFRCCLISDSSCSSRQRKHS